ncbi:chloride channel protein [Leptolyngbya sp. FACHB-711]|uniref:chloride channel protein n=1 Tax=Leptolyngbya sp. FACHB-711 TaxID=2692813 RepID=UPI00168915B1|nr:chloride channel protein [Leptolyngbya sp. FACHB-711]MBD1853119.1 chloride channel protein [Cyanobacteria bacterium FACHB-502]MBD2025970.1 chloride channel protein [Leptolyngbya sp. FACHB-711]
MGYLTLPNRFRSLMSGSKLAIFEACVIGVVSGLSAVVLKWGIGFVGSWRVQLSYQMPVWFVLPAIGLVGGVLSGWLIERLAPEAAGSGIPQVKAALANVPIALNLRVAAIKLVSVILAVGSGLNLGRQGPTVQVGAALAAQLSQWIPTSPEYRRQLIAAGAAAGLAAGFNAPIAGVLFVVEEFLQDFSGLTLGTAILASFIGAVVSRLIGGQGLNLNSIVTESQVSFSLQDVPFFLILGLLAGLLGGLFSQGIFASLALFRRELPWGTRLSLPMKIGLAGLISGAVVVILPPEFRDNSGLQEFLSTGDAPWHLTLLAFVIKFCLTLLAYGAGTPGGLFAPALLLGAALGHLVGYGAQTLETMVGIPLGFPAGISDPSTYALAGMGAFFSAVTRGPITAIVIVFEITTDFNLVLPLMIGSVIAYLITDRIASGSIYTRLLAWNGIHLDKYVTKSGAWTELKAADLMQRRVETLDSNLSLPEVVQAFSRSHHRGFPVMTNGKLIGIVTQSDLADRLPHAGNSFASRHAPTGQPAILADIMTPQPVTVSPTDRLTHVLFLLNRFKLSRLPVTEGQKLVGIITRADIIRAEADQISGENKSFGPQPEPSYVVYQTRSPATGKGRLLVPLSNPHTAPLLLRLAATIARERDYELECLQVVCVPRGTSPSEASIRTTNSRKLLKRAEQIGRASEVPIHTQVRLAHDSAQAILEAIEERHIDLLLMGWKGSTTSPGRVFGNIVDTVIRQADCEVMMVKLGDIVKFDRWLIPVAGGPNAQQAVRLLPTLTMLSTKPDVHLCQVFDDTPSSHDTAYLKQLFAEVTLKLPCPVTARSLCGRSISDTILDLARSERCDVIMLGASREGLLQQVIKGNIPESIARNTNRTVIIVRGEITPQEEGLFKL